MIKFAGRNKPTRMDAEMTIKTILLASVVALTPLAGQAQWKEYVRIDRITGEQIFAGIVSSATLADQPRPFLFNAARGMLLARCGQAVGFIFATAGGIDGPVYKIEFSNLDELRIRARVDDQIAEFQAENRRNGDTPVLVFRGADNDSLYSVIVNSGKLLLEIPTVEHGDLYFSFDLAGTRKLHDRTCGTELAD